jgi:Ca2+/Na+ antiporter
MRHSALHAVAFGLVVSTIVHLVLLALGAPRWYAWGGVVLLVACVVVLFWVALPERDGEEGT